MIFHYHRQLTIGWTAAQKAEADAKVNALSNANTVKTPANRGGTSAHQDINQHMENIRSK